MVTLIADCGSTKTEWAIVNPTNENHAEPARTFRTTGFNAAVTPHEEIARILTTEVAPELSGRPISHVHFYGAGCIGGKVNDSLQSLLASIFPNAKIEIQGDLLAAARALFGKNPGIACILGTGSNCGIYDGTAITLNTPPMGYILGDEGSGAILGRKLINLIFKHPGLLPSEITDDFHSTYHLSQTDIIEQVYRQPAANRFLASFCPFLKRHIIHPVIHDLIHSSFQEFLHANLPISHQPSGNSDIPLSKFTSGANKATLPIGFVGSIAHYFDSILIDVCHQAGFTNPIIVKSPVLGLCSYHRHTLSNKC